jgi:hypothetical protein
VKAKRKRTDSYYDRQLREIIHKFIGETGKTAVDWDELIDWAEEKGHLTPKRVDPRKALKRALAKAAREDFTYDDDGEPVRWLHAYVIKNGEIQQTMWGPMDSISPENMRVSVSLRRRGYRSGIIQCDRDIRYFNKRHNPGDPIEFDWNFNPDVEENRMPSEYPDVPPEE